MFQRLQRWTFTATFWLLLQKSEKCVANKSKCSGPEKPLWIFVLFGQSHEFNIEHRSPEMCGANLQNALSIWDRWEVNRRKAIKENNVLVIVVLFLWQRLCLVLSQILLYIVSAQAHYSVTLLTYHNQRTEQIREAQSQRQFNSRALLLKAVWTLYFPVFCQTVTSKSHLSFCWLPFCSSTYSDIRDFL